MSPPIESFSSLEVIELIRRINPREASGHDQIRYKAIKELAIKGIGLITSIFNAILRIEYCPKPWKISLITLIPKPGKPIHETSSYRRISLLPTLSKLFEKMLTKRFLPLLEDLTTMPDHQFGFRKQYSTTEQIHRLTHKISQDLEKKKILLCGIPGHSAGVRQSVAWRTFVQNKENPTTHFLLHLKIISNQ